MTVLHGNWDAQSGYAGALQMLRETPNFSAVLVGNDQMALGVLSAFHQHQVAVPGEKSVIGYDDTYESSFFYPALSTVSLDLDLQGKKRCGGSSPAPAVRHNFIHPAGAPGDTSFQRRQNWQGKDLQAIAEQLRAIAHRLAPGNLRRETRLRPITPQFEHG